MPSFAFWKSSKPDESKSPLLSDAAVKAELSVIIPNTSKAVDLNPGNQDTGVFLFDDDAQEIPGDETPVIGQASALPIIEVSEQPIELESGRPKSVTKTDTSLLDIDEASPYLKSPALTPEVPSTAHADTAASSNHRPESISTGGNSRFHALSVDEAIPSPIQAQHPSPLPKELGPTLNIEKKTASTRLEKIETSIRDRDSGVYMSDSESSPALSRPCSVVSADHNPLRSRVASLSKPATPSPQRTNSIARLQRPAELNLGFNSATDAAKPKSELDMRYDLIRNSKTQSKAALRSPTQLLQDRLNMTPVKKDIEEKIRVFTPPRATVNGCLLPGPGARAEAFTSTSVRATTEAGRRPAWWCKIDKLVVFDGVEQQADGEVKLRTRTSKGLTIARRRGDLETVVIPMDCDHCIEMLNRHEWKYDMRVCKRSVCWDCKERCKWELQQEKMMSAATPRADVNRERADSVLQDEQHGMNKAIAV